MRNLLEKIYMYIRRFFLQRNTLFSSPDTPQPQNYPSEQSSMPPQYREPSSDPASMQQGYPQQSPQRGGMNPWVVGGLGALGGGLAGYGLGQAVGELKQDTHDEYGSANDQGDFGSNSEDFGGDFGGGDFGGE